MIMVSACLLGKNCRYDGGAKPCERVIDRVNKCDYVAFCPECMGKMTIPRKPCEIIGGDGGDVLNGKAKVINSKQEDMTSYYIAGAKEALKLAFELKPELIILKSNSPSCGVGEIYDGSFCKRKIVGDGVTAALLKKNGFKVQTEIGGEYYGEEHNTFNR